MKNPMTAEQYLSKCETARNRAACKRIDRKEFAIRTAWQTVALIVACVAGGMTIHLACMFTA